MSYIGRGLDAISNVEKLDNITFDGSATYALEKSSAAFTPVGANNLLVSIDGVIQQGNFSVSTTNIVFDWSPTSSNTNNFILHYGTGVLNVPADGSIVAAKMAANSVDSDSYVDGSIDTAHIDALQVTGAKLNTDVISAQTELAVAPADADEFMVSDGGVLKRVDYSLIKGGDNTPAFSAYKETITGIADNTITDVVCDSERFDTDGTYDTSTGRFTPGVIGRYGFYITSRINQAATSTRFQVILGKNGASASAATGYITGEQSGAGSATYPQAHGFAITDCDDVADYFTLRLWQDSGGDATFYTTNFMGFRIII